MAEENMTSNKDPQHTPEYLAQRAAFEATYSALRKERIAQEQKKKEAAPTPASENLLLPKPWFSSSKYHAPEGVGREEYLALFFRAMRKLNWSEHFAYANPSLIHRNRIDSIDFYHKDMHRALDLFLRYYGTGRLYVSNGFRSPASMGASVHSVGLALDIEAPTDAAAYRIMNAAYLAGFPTIVPGGDGESGERYIHLDIAPNDGHHYGVGVYSGPWS